MKSNASDSRRAKIQLTILRAIVYLILIFLAVLCLFHMNRCISCRTIQGYLHMGLICFHQCGLFLYAHLDLAQMPVQPTDAQNNFSPCCLCIGQHKDNH